MDVTQIPFNKFIGIKHSDKPEFSLLLEKSPHCLNHINTFHAGILYSLAEATSGFCLLNSFPDLKDNVVPVLRKATVKYSKPVNSEVYSRAKISEEAKENARSSLTGRGRTSLEINVELFDNENNKVFSSTFEWFVTIMF